MKVKYTVVYVEWCSPRLFHCIAESEEDAIEQFEEQHQACDVLDVIEDPVDIPME
jgi:hypothetical protein